MKSRNSAILIKLSALGIMLAASFGQNTQAAVNTLTSDIAPYVFPQNRPASPSDFTYAPDGNGYLMLSADHKTIDRYDIKTGKKIETLLDLANTRENKLNDIEGFEFTDNMRYVLVYRNSEYIYRRSFKAEYYVYELYSRLLKPLSYDFKTQRDPVISPDGRMIAFVAEDNNIYVKKLDYDSQVAVTKDGKVNEIINGVSDWVYEEEFSTTCSMTWAPDNLNLCFLKYNESKVPMYTLPVYEGTCNPDKQYAYYPGTYSYKYPVAGETNSKVTVHSYDVETRKTKEIPLPDSRIEYIPRISYGDTPERLMVCTLNRDQNHYEIYCANPKSCIAKSVYVDESKAWINENAYTDLKLCHDHFYVMSDRSGYNHVYKYSYAGALVKQITKGDFDVTAFYGVDAKGNIYYQAAAPSPLVRVVYRIDPKGVVSAVSKSSGTNSANFSLDMAYAVFSYNDTTTPPTYNLCTADGKQVRSILDNSAYAKKFVDLPKKEFFTMTSDGVTLNGYIIKPANASASHKCPVIMSQYSGPGSQMVLDKWSVDWEQYFAKQGYVIVCVDGRGTGGRGRQFMDVVYRNLGHYETIDQVNAAKYAASLPYVDVNRIGIYGWSYGGYEALMAASAPGAPYAAAVSIAPVTDWRYYDSVYTERFMLTPQQNESGYNKSSAIAASKNLVCPILIMYGTSDDNVHPVNSIQYVSTLESHGQYCDMLLFPNMNHSIYGCGVRAVVYAKMLDYFNRIMK